MIHTILVPLDTSPLAELALPHVRAIAHAFDARIELVSVLESSTPEFEAVDSVEWRLNRDQREACLQRTAVSLREEGLDVSWKTAGGNAAEQIVDLARTRGANLVVLTTHGQGGLSEFPLSGTVSKVVSSVQTSVFVVRPGGSETAGEPMTYQRIVVPVDCSPRGDWAVSLAAKLGRSQKAELLLVAVVEPPKLLGSPREWTEQKTLARRLTELNREIAEGHLSGLLKKVGSEGLRIRTLVVEDSDAARALQAVADEDGCSLIVLSAHGQSPGSGWPYGSMTSRLLEHCDRPVLVFQDAEPSSRPGSLWRTRGEWLGVST